MIIYRNIVELKSNSIFPQISLISWLVETLDKCYMRWNDAFVSFQSGDYILYILQGKDEGQISDFTDVETFISLKVSSLEEVFQWKYNICLVVGKEYICNEF